jgi:hypothetical protein
MSSNKDKQKMRLLRQLDSDSSKKAKPGRPKGTKVLPDAKVSVNTRLSLAHRKGLEVIAKREQISMQAVIRRFLDEGLKSAGVIK